MLRPAFLLCAAAVLVSGAENEVQKDTYAIYSMLFNPARTSHRGDFNPVYLIADATAPGEESPCVNLPADRQARFAEVLADFAARRWQTTHMISQLKIRRPYRYLSAAETAKFQAASKSRREPADLFRVGNVYFDRGRTLALTSLFSWCGSLCALFEWRVFERGTGGEWQEKAWAACGWIASAESRREMAE